MCIRDRLTADEVLELAKDYLYVAVTTDVTDTISLNYDTQYDYDDSKSNTCLLYTSRCV